MASEVISDRIEPRICNGKDDDIAARIPDPDTISSLSLAYIGDSVYELIMRTIALSKHNGSANMINRFAKKYSNASTQAQMISAIADDLTEREMHIYKRGRNAKSVSAPKNCTISQYRMATGLEALFAHLYIEGKWDRAVELAIAGIEKLSKDISEDIHADV